jgi:hypothetical protein
MLPHPVHQLYLAIAQKIPVPQPRGIAKPQAASRKARMIEILPSEQYYDTDDLKRNYQVRPLPCIKLDRSKYLYLGSPTYLGALKAIGVAEIPFLVMPRLHRVDHAELYEETVALTAQIAFENLRGEPLYLRSEVRGQLYIVLRRLGLDSYFFGSFSEEHILKHILQLAPSTVRRKQQQASTRSAFPCPYKCKELDL